MSMEINKTAYINCLYALCSRYTLGSGSDKLLCYTKNSPMGFLQCFLNRHLNYQIHKGSYTILHNVEAVVRRRFAKKRVCKICRKTPVTESLFP